MLTSMKMHRCFVFTQFFHTAIKKCPSAGLVSVAYKNQYFNESLVYNSPNLKVAYQHYDNLFHWNVTFVT